MANFRIKLYGGARLGIKLTETVKSPLITEINFGWCLCEFRGLVAMQSEWVGSKWGCWSSMIRCHPPLWQLLLSNIMNH